MKEKHLKNIHKHEKLTEKDRNIINFLIEKNKKIKTNKVSVTINMEIKGQSRHRAARFGGYYDPSAAHKKEVLAEFLRKAKKQLKHIDIPISTMAKIKIIHYRRIPGSFSKINRILAELKILKPDNKPDLDNVGKLIIDALTTRKKKPYAFFKDDVQITDIKLKSYYSYKPRCKIIITYNKKKFKKYKRGITA